MYSLSRCFRPVWVSFFRWALNNIFKRTIDYSHWQYLFSYRGSQWLQSTVLFNNILQNIFVCIRIRIRISHRFGTTWGWVNDDSNSNFGWSLSLNLTNSAFPSHRTSLTESIILLWCSRHFSEKHRHPRIIKLATYQVYSVFSCF